MKNKIKEIGIPSFIVIIITLVLFVIALYTKGLTHDILLEIAVFLISVKLIIMADKNSSMNGELNQKLDAIDEKIKIIEENMKQ